MKTFVLLIFSALLLSSCATYHFTTQSLLEQCASAQRETKVNILIAPPFVFFPGIVTGNSLRELEVLDKQENEKIIPVTHRTGVRVTKKDGSRNTFYFDTLLIQDSTITGKKSHFIGVSIKPIKLGDVQKIELQN
jgi:hypothetical protein